ncbi:MAG: M48 family metalloprotease [Candidatus Acidiferrales bacterium]
MRVLKIVFLALVMFAAALPLAAGDQPSSLDQVVDHIISRESALMTSLRQYSPLVETYIQNMRHDPTLGTAPAGDRYFLGRAELAKGVELRSLSEKTGKAHKLFGGIGSFFSFSVEYLPRGFLQMIYLDMNGFDRQHYNFDYVRREFLGEVRCLVFDVTPLAKSGKGRFLGRIWVEDQDYNIVRFNGAYTGSSNSKFYFHFDSWRVNTGPGLWLPAFIYSEESDMPYALTKRLQFKSQTRLWGYNLGHAGQEQELSRVLVEAPTPIRDQSEVTNDPSPVQAQRSWDRQAEDNVVDRLQRIGLLAPRGEVDKVLETVVNNLEVTNNLDIQPEVRCRVLLTSTFESFSLGHTIVLSRGLIDVLPDEAALATMVAHELSHVVLGHRIDSQYAFFDRLLFDDKDTFRHFLFARNPGEEEAANQKATEMLKNSPYKDQLANAGLFAQALDARAKDIPNLVSPHLGNRVPVNADLRNAAVQLDPKDPKRATQIAALPLGGRIKLDPWSDRLEMLKSKPSGSISEREKMPFEVTPFMPYLTRQSSAQTQAPVTAESKEPAKKPQ